MNLVWLATVLAGAPVALAVDLPWDEPPGPTDVVPRGSAYVEPDLVTVREKATMDWVYVVGEGGMRAGDGVRIEDPLFHGMRVSKYSLIALDPTECTPMVGSEPSTAVVTASTTAPATLGLARSTLSPDLHQYAYTEVWVEEGLLAEGDEIRVRFGDVDAGADCGHQQPDRAYREVVWRGWERLEAAPDFAALEPFPTYDVQPLVAPARLHVAAPSVVQVGEVFEVTVAVLDTYGNALEAWAGELSLPSEAGGASAEVEAGEPAWRHLTASLDAPGIARLAVVASGGLAGTSNPIEVLEDAPSMRLYWGDIHTHHGHSTELSDGSWHDENVAYGRDVMGLDVTSESMKGQPLEIDGAAVWSQLVDNCTVYTEADRHVSLLGWEWMGGAHGHHNIYYDSCAGELGNLGIETLAEVDGLWAWLDDHEARTGAQALTVPHASLYTGHDWFRAHSVDPDADDRYRTVAEVYSAWGTSMEPGEEDGSVPGGLREGLRMGFLAASDNHTGWMGNTYWSEKNTPPGLGAFWAPELTTASIFASLRGRATYGTTGERILLRYEAALGDEVIPAGGVVVGPAGKPVLRWSAHGTAELARVSLLAIEVGGVGAPWVLDEVAPNALDATGEYDLRKRDWEGEELAVWLEVEQADGELAWSSPIWLERDCGCGGGSAWLLAPVLIGWGRRRRRRA